MPGYSVILYSVPKGDFNTPDIEGNTVGAEKLLSFFADNMRSFEDLIYWSAINDSMIDIFTSTKNEINYKRLNLFQPIEKAAINYQNENKDQIMSQRGLFCDRSDVSIFTRVL